MRDRIVSMVEVATTCLLGVVRGFFFAFSVAIVFSRV
jgi:uncharacterized membrane protein